MLDEECGRIFDRDRCVERFKSLDWTTLYEQTDVNLANTILEDNILSVIDMEAPMKTVQTRSNYSRWLSDTTKATMSDRDAARDSAVQSDVKEDWDHYRSLRNHCTELQRKDKSDYNRAAYKLIEETNDSSRLHGMTRDLLGWTRSGPPSLLKVDGRSYRKQKDLADLLATHYETKVRKIMEAIPQVNFDPLQLLKIAFDRWRPPGRISKCVINDVTEREVLEMISKMKNSHSFGHNGVDAATLKIGAKQLAAPIKFVG